MASIRKSLTQTFASTYLQLALQIVGMVVLARLLGPEEIGVYTIAAVFVNFAQELRNFAVGHYIIQEPDLTRQRYRAAFSVTLILGFTMALLLYLVAPYAGAFYEEPGVTAVLSLLAVNFLLVPFGTIVLSVFRRELQFGKVMLAEISSSLVHTATGIILAFMGLSYMSLAWAAIAGTVTSLILAQAMRPAGIPWLPGLKEIRRVFSFGLYMTGSTMVTRFGTDLPNLIVGKTLGLSAVGLVSRGSGLIQIFHRLVIKGVQPVMMPYLSAKKRGGENLGTPYMYAVTCVTGLAWPFYASLGLLADPVVNLLLGSKWTEIVPLLGIWVLAPSISVLTPFAQSVFVATGSVKRFFRIQTYMTLTRVLVVAGAAFHSIEALVIAFIVSQVIQQMILAPAIYRLINIDAHRHWQTVLPSLKVALFTGLGVFLSSLLPDLPQAPLLMELGAGGLGAFIGWALGCHLTSHPLIGEIKRALSAARQRLDAR
jgi:O-antigen/teichoic acid export membrane protein